MRSRSAPDLAGRCPRCRLRSDLCLCAEVLPIASPVRLVVVRHALEALKSTNTARLAALAIDRVEFREHGAEGADPVRLDDLDPRAAMLVFPSAEPTPAPVVPPATLVLLDGNWGQAKRMLGRFPALQKLPRLSLARPALAPVRVRAAPRPEQLSTIEAISGALRWLGNDEAAAKLDRLFATFVARVLESRGRRSTR
jgi:DTW domain-containing protein